MWATTRGNERIGTKANDDRETDVNLVTQKTVDAKGFKCHKSRGARTAIELFLAGLRAWKLTCSNCSAGWGMANNRNGPAHLCRGWAL